MIKNLTIFIVGIMIGATCCYVKLKKELDILENELNSMCTATYRETTSHIENMKIKIANNIDNTRIDDVIKGVTPKKGLNNLEKIDYTKFFTAKEKRAIKEETAQQVEDEIIKSGKYELNAQNCEVRQEPEIIDEESFIDECDWYDKITLGYYTKNSVLVDETTKEIYEEPEDIIGMDAYQEMTSGKIDVVYVRDNRLSIDYEICICDEEWVG